ncbi:hypothetical protein DZ860_19270 [Vibrio sinensis]|uniref:Uncharacterized protein n=1 Tax=Vibrio sinensis TaxID=2302434 RepID=A0A3A6Q7P0_9VIBR|nr:hypothetical protein [Vibrio sinensis]RJX67158.1 hypothetical protein DZ860_19270 [Vibrio sinensis]
MFAKKYGEALFKYKLHIAASLILLNTILIGLAYSQTTEWYGVIETKNSHQISFSTQYKNQLKTSKTFTNTVDDDVRHENESDFYVYNLQKTGNNSFLALNPEMKVKVLDQNVYALDERCSLIFRGSSKMTISNVGFECLN